MTFGLGWKFSIEQPRGDGREEGFLAANKHPPRTVGGNGRICIIVAALIDTNILVYLYDTRYPVKQKVAEQVLRSGIDEDNIRVPHQALVEFVSAVTKRTSPDGPLLNDADARQEAEEFLHQFTVLYPNDQTFRLALRGMAAYKISWFDAHMWAYAEHFGLSEIISEDFQHNRLYGSVRVRNPFTQ